MKVGEYKTEMVSEIDKTMTGRVIFIHPRGRYYTVEFENNGTVVRESYLIEGGNLK